jgi:alkylation response protein AidB-like acyl-CoA dehydrogenase
VDFGLSETEEMVRSSAREFLSREAGPALARLVAGGDATALTAFWRRVSEMGWPGLAVSEKHGGADMGLLPLAALMEQWAGHLAPGPLFETAVLAAPLIEEAATERLKREILPAAADGSAAIAVAVLEERAEWSAAAIDAVAVPTGNGWAITGEKRFVAYGADANWLLVAARTGDGREEISLFLVDRETAGITREPVKHASGSPVYTVQLNEALVPAGRMVGAQGRAWPLIEDMARRGAAFRAVQLAGTGQAVVDGTVRYVTERKQFGQPVGSFQAIQHTLADMAVAVRAVRHQAYRAVWAIENRSATVERDVARASMAACSLIPEVCWKAHQSHGAIGFTWEHDLHLFTRRAISWAAEFGGERSAADALAKALSL